MVLIVEVVLISGGPNRIVLISSGLNSGVVVISSGLNSVGGLNFEWS